MGVMKDSSVSFNIKYVWGYLHKFDSTKNERNYVLIHPRSEGWANYYSSMLQKEMNRMETSATKGVFADNMWPFYVLFFLKLPKELQVDLNNDGVMNGEDNWIWAEGMVDFSYNASRGKGIS